jgi:hypothetical protein
METSAGAGIITVQALYDGNNNFYPNGKTLAISTNSTVLGAKNMPIAVAIAGSTDPVATADLLSVKTEEFGTILLNLTESEYIEIVREAGGGGAPVPPIPPGQVMYGAADSTPTSDSSLAFDPITGLVVAGDVSMRHLIGNSDNPTIEAGAGAGAGATVDIVGDDMGGYIVVNSGSTPASNDIVATVTFSAKYAKPPQCVLLTPGNLFTQGASIARACRVPCPGESGSPTTETFTLYSSSTGLVASSSYVFWYFVKQ